jgi:hypothetical protein
MTRVFHFIVLSMIVATSAYAGTIGRLADGASCRDEKGAVRQPPVRPAPRAEIERAQQGMVKTVRDIAGAACFLYLREVALAESPPDCDRAETAGPRKNVSGTLGQQPCSDR